MDEPSKKPKSNRHLGMTAASWLKPLCDAYDEDLISLLFECHRTAARENKGSLSNLLFFAASEGSRNVTQSIIAALASTGGNHGPIEYARLFLFKHCPEEWTPSLGLIPGFGNSFHKNGVDPAFQPLEFICRHACPQLQTLQDALWRHGKKIYPNAAAFSAIVAEIVGLKPGMEILLFALPRMPIWMELLM